MDCNSVRYTLQLKLQRKIEIKMRVRSFIFISTLKFKRLLKRIIDEHTIHHIFQIMNFASFLCFCSEFLTALLLNMTYFPKQCYLLYIFVSNFDMSFICSSVCMKALRGFRIF
jgi:hypothetical protein